LLPARGNYSDLASNVAALLDGEICYAIDQDQYYQKEGSVLVSVGASKAQGVLAETALQDAPSDGSEYVRKNGAWAASTGGGGGGGAASLNELSDVDLTTPAAIGDVLMHDGSEFVAFAADQIVSAVGAQPRTTFAITANGTQSYLFAGPGFSAPTPNPDITLVRGQTYVFSNSTGSHPFQISSVSNPSNPVFTAFNDGVTNNNTIGDVTFTVPFDTSALDLPNFLVYQCTAHPDMTGNLFLVSNSSVDLETTSSTDLVDFSATAADTVGQVPTWDGTQYVPQAPAGGGGGSEEAAYTDVTIPLEDIIVAHTFDYNGPNDIDIDGYTLNGDYDNDNNINFPDWAGNTQSVGYGPLRRSFWDFDTGSAESGGSVDWPADLDTSPFIIQFDFRWVEDGTPTRTSFIAGIGSSTNGSYDGTVDGFSIRMTNDYGLNSEVGSGEFNQDLAQLTDGCIYLSDDSKPAESKFVVGTKPLRWIENLDGLGNANTIELREPDSSMTMVTDGMWHQVAFVIHKDELGVQSGAFSCYVDGELVDYIERGPTEVTTGGGDFDKFFIGAPSGGTTTSNHWLDQLYVARGEPVPAKYPALEVTRQYPEYYVGYGPNGGYYGYSFDLILQERSFRIPIQKPILLSSLADVDEVLPQGHGHSLAWDSIRKKYAPMPTPVVREVVFDNSGYAGNYPYSSSAAVWHDNAVGNMMIHLGTNKIAIWTGEPDFDSGNGGWMEWSINGIYAA
jgi:hypothetical protein